MIKICFNHLSTYFSSLPWNIIILCAASFWSNFCSLSFLQNHSIMPLEHLFNHTKLLLTSTFFPPPVLKLDSPPRPPTSPSFLETIYYFIVHESPGWRWVKCPSSTYIPSPDHYFSTILLIPVPLSYLATLFSTVVHSYYLLTTWTNHSFIEHSRNWYTVFFSCPQSEWLHIYNQHHNLSVFDLHKSSSNLLFYCSPNHVCSHTLGLLSCEIVPS